MPAQPATRTTARAVLSDGTLVEIRPLRDGERTPVIQVFDGMSARSRFLRFLAPVPRLREQMLRSLTTLDDRDRVAWGAFTAGRCIAIARYVRSPDDPSAADLAIAVADESHQRGLGRLMLEVVAAVAEDNRIRTFAVTVHPENHGSLAILRGFGARLALVDGLHEGRVTISGITRDRRVPEQRQRVSLNPAA